MRPTRRRVRASLTDAETIEAASRHVRGASHLRDLPVHLDRPGMTLLVVDGEGFACAHRAPPRCSPPAARPPPRTCCGARSRAACRAPRSRLTSSRRRTSERSRPVWWRGSWSPPAGRCSCAGRSGRWRPTCQMVRICDRGVSLRPMRAIPEQWSSSSAGSWSGSHSASSWSRCRWPPGTATAGTAAAERRSASGPAGLEDSRARRVRSLARSTAHGHRSGEPLLRAGPMDARPPVGRLHGGMPRAVPASPCDASPPRRLGRARARHRRLVAHRRSPDRRLLRRARARGATPLPADPAERTECRRLFDAFFDELGVAVRAWAYAYQLPLRRSTAHAWIDGAPAFERMIVPVAYPLLAAIVKRSLKLGPDTIPRERRVIDASLTDVEARLADGRRYLMGDRLTRRRPRAGDAVRAGRAAGRVPRPASDHRRAAGVDAR